MCRVPLLDETQLGQRTILQYELTSGPSECPDGDADGGGFQHALDIEELDRNQVNPQTRSRGRG